MSRHTDTYSLWKCPVTERQHRALWILLQAAVIGLMLGIVTRAAWDFGIVASITLALRDFGVAVWTMLQGLPEVCLDCLQFIS